MAEVIDSDKDFKVIKVSAFQLAKSLGGYGICDHCNKTPFQGYYIAVLNHWLCEKDYHEWHEGAVNHPEDREIEQRNFERTKQLLNI